MRKQYGNPDSHVFFKSLFEFESVSNTFLRRLKICFFTAIIFVWNISFTKKILTSTALRAAPPAGVRSRGCTTPCREISKHNFSKF